MKTQGIYASLDIFSSCSASQWQLNSSKRCTASACSAKSTSLSQELEETPL